MTIVVTSKNFKEGELLGHRQTLSAAYGFGCAGENLSPQLSWSGAPPETKSFAITCFDPDAPTGSGFWHWVLVNIPPHVTSLEEGAGNPGSGKAPAGSLETRTDFGQPGYGGPCSPPGSNFHRYIFAVHALSVDQLPVNADTSAAVVGFMLGMNTIAKGELHGIFMR
ncbi:MAG: YbhB/YbcL family Raf kinase inhibitor-like protein [Gammaproteobacteria bacterium]|nr:YbhB/YbcL family Raf kinase inhibitor-like protein [Gammaproteobacteria bacterium]MBI5615476.1 YbhB/YbcL family Raf kinase inhibitor-like protein [Gammaproteobacteria bacterium]